MRKWIIVLAAAVAASAAHADVLGLRNIKVDGSVEVKGQQAKNETDVNDAANDHRGNTVTRVRLGLNLDVTEDVTSRIEVVRSGGASSLYGSSGRPTTIATEEGAFAFHNAYLDLNEFLRLDKVRVGRQYTGRPGDLLMYIAPVWDDALSVNSIDGLSLWKELGPVNITAFTGKTHDDDTNPGSGISDTDRGDTVGDSNISYITVGSDKLLPLSEDSGRIPLEIGFYTGTDSNATASTDNVKLSIIDLRAGFRSPNDRLMLDLEFAMNGGEQNSAGGGVDFKGSALTLMAAFSDDENRFGVHALFANASGDAQANNEDKSFHDLSTITGFNVSDLRYGEILSNSNTFQSVTGLGPGLDTGSQGTGLNVIGIGGNYGLPFWDQKLKLTGDYFMVKASKVPSGADKGIGNELDLAVKYMHNDNVQAALGYAMLVPDDGLSQRITLSANGPDDNVTKLWAKLMVKWGM